MESIDEIIQWHPRSLQVWLREIEQVDLKDDLILAMRGLSKNVIHLILENLSSHIRKMILDTMKKQDKIPLALIEKAKQRILNIANDLIEIGELSEPDEEYNNIDELKNYTSLPSELLVNNTKNLIESLTILGRYAQEKGLLSLEEALRKINDPFLQEGLQLIMDGTDPNLVEEILRNRLQAITYHRELLYNLMIEGILGIQLGNSSWTLNMRLRSHLPPEMDDKKSS